MTPGGGCDPGATGWKYIAGGGGVGVAVPLVSSLYGSDDGDPAGDVGVIPSLRRSTVVMLSRRLRLLFLRIQMNSQMTVAMIFDVLA